MKKLSLFLALLIAISTIGCESPNTDMIQASGQIEATEVVIASEISARIIEVLVDEGDTVKAGDPLFRLDDSLLLAQKQAAQATLDSINANVQVAQSNLDTAQAQYNITLSNALAQEEANRRTTWDRINPDEFNQPAWYFSKEEQINSAQAEIDAAMSALEVAQVNLAETENKAGNTAFLEIEQQLSDARMAYDVAMTVLEDTSNASDGAELQDAAQTADDDAKTNLESVQNEYKNALTTTDANDVLNARAEAEVARERYYTSLDVLRTLQTGEHSLSVIAAGKAVDQAKAMLEQAQSAVAASQANLNLILTQMENLTVRASLDGIVLVRSIEMGEVIQAGMPAMTIGNLETLKLTVYIPETQYGEINLGLSATISVDSFPDEVFTAIVTRISDKAEFTPQNVQTKEGRQTTVYAVELSVDNVNGKLKPGMPVDVIFDHNGS
jgi:HlyD family secretion protein